MPISIACDKTQSLVPKYQLRLFTFILISMSLDRFQESKQDLIGSSLLNKRETGSS